MKSLLPVILAFLTSPLAAQTLINGRAINPATSITVTSYTATATGSSQYSIQAASGIKVNAGGVNAPFLSGTHYGDASHVIGLTQDQVSGLNPRFDGVALATNTINANSVPYLGAAQDVDVGTHSITASSMSSRGNLVVGTTATIKGMHATSRISLDAPGSFYSSEYGYPAYLLNAYNTYGQIQSLNPGSRNLWALGYGASAQANGTGILYWDGDTNRVGINTNSPLYSFDNNGDSYFRGQGIFTGSTTVNGKGKFGDTLTVINGADAIYFVNNAVRMGRQVVFGTDHYLGLHGYTGTALFSDGTSLTNPDMIAEAGVIRFRPNTLYTSTITSVGAWQLPNILTVGGANGEGINLNRANGSSYINFQDGSGTNDWSFYRYDANDLRLYSNVDTNKRFSVSSVFSGGGDVWTVDTDNLRVGVLNHDPVSTFSVTGSADFGSIKKTSIAVDGSINMPASTPLNTDSIVSVSDNRGAASLGLDSEFHGYNSVTVQATRANSANSDVYLKTFSGVTRLHANGYGNVGIPTGLKVGGDVAAAGTTDVELPSKLTVNGSAQIGSVAVTSITNGGNVLVPNGVVAATGSFTATGDNQYSLQTSSGISMAHGMLDLGDGCLKFPTGSQCAPFVGGAIGGSGTTGKIPVFTTPSSIGDSYISQVSSGVTVSSHVRVDGDFYADSYLNLPSFIVGVGWVIDNFLSQVNGAQKNFTMSQAPSSEQSIFLVLDGLIQSQGVDYTFTAPNQIAFTTAPASDTSSCFASYTINTSTLPAVAVTSGVGNAFINANTFGGPTIFNGFVSASSITVTTNTVGFLHMTAVYGSTVSVSVNASDGNNVYFISCNAASGNVTYTLPTISSSVGRTLHFKQIDSSGNICTLDGNGAETVDGQPSFSINTQYESISVWAGSDEWHLY